ncbi:FimB/Mfa2 family fimbrial subunit [Parabacteroides pacaensis]|uniref:FimB/Mfa2 family fimbrial subunit n=1 Tax=Parabacteroides pacaensis TaxID=2086575 RepID=UPI000D1010B5|nr:FimB/Mfa2 family fimbrial subunit [Parabacteroides pacaensis]
MKKLLLILIVFTALYGCSKDDDKNTPPSEVPESELISPKLYATLASRTPLTGVLEVYPCYPNSSTYYGNYYKGVLTPINPHYTVSSGSALTSANPVYLPIGDYNMIYWGTPKPDTVTYSRVAIRDPRITLGGDLAQQYFSLRKYESASDTTYYPTFDLVHAVNSVVIGSEELSATLQRATAALIVILNNKDNLKFNSIIYSTEIIINSVADRINFYTAAPSDQTRAVRFPLTMSADSMQMSNPAVMVFPTASNPLLQIVITLKNGAIKTYQQNLKETLDANSRLILTLTLNEIFEEGTSSGGFQVDKWNEKKETIDLPPLP